MELGSECQAYPSDSGSEWEGKYCSGWPRDGKDGLDLGGRVQQ